MNQQVKEKWTAALRSGDYRQGTHALRKTLPDGSQQHCCYGVLCELAVKEGVIPDPKPYVFDTSRAAFESLGVHYGVTSTLPRAVEIWADLESFQEAKIGDEITNLMKHNDDHNATFAQIADAVEQQF
jgi:hypothetical protein